MHRFLATVWAFLIGIPAPADVEKWADPNLKAPSGLQLWLDASRQNAAREARSRPVVREGDPIPVWYDGSGHERHVAQSIADARPMYHSIGGAGLLRFDGNDDCLRAAGVGKRLKDFTAFIVAAPHSNFGDFRGFLAFNERDQKDYTSGLNVDMSAYFTSQFDAVNVEGPGFGGLTNLRNGGQPFGQPAVVEVVGDSARRSVRVVVDGKPGRSRPWNVAPLSMEEITVGARFYENGPGPQRAQGFLDGDIAEILVFDRVLDEKETRTVRSYLDRKYAKLRELLPGEAVAGMPLKPVSNPPAVQMFVPGFAVREIPVKLPNVNNVRYRPDGKLVALCYNGDIHLLSDTNGDGLEDRAELFLYNRSRLRTPIGMALAPPGYAHGQGVFVASKGKCSLILEPKAAGEAAKEIIVATGWKELQHNVDVLGVAVDPKDGSVYFGLGTGDFTNAYMTDRSGKASYRLDAERGAILRVAPDFKSRSIVATGVRFSVGMEFNRAGDLFCTDQEGATWLPNGNPLDELLHIEKGRHYGFPPRHPKHLPNVIDEPSVVDFGPQHQSTCGLTFNEPVAGGPVFGPDWWRGDAFVTGYSRGKLYRVKLVRTAAGYVGMNQLIACLNMLAADQCVSPKGDLVVAVHSGGPDWGSGPSGIGKLYKISYVDRAAPQPVLAWSAGPRETAVGFDRPLPTERLTGIQRETSLVSGAYVRAGDRFESLRPGYAVVGMQMRSPRKAVPVLGASVSPDRQTLMLATDATTDLQNLALTLPGLGRPELKETQAGFVPQHPEIDLDFGPSGVECDWISADGMRRWHGWLPHLDLAAARGLAAGSRVHDQLWSMLTSSGTLRLRTKLNLNDILRPAVQPGSRIDYSLPPEKAAAGLTSNHPIELNAQGVSLAIGKADGDLHRVSLTRSSSDNRLIPIDLVLRGASPTLSIHVSTNEDARPRALHPGRFVLPWIRPRSAGETPTAEAEIPEIAGGSWSRGRRVFFSNDASCSKCHRSHGEGGGIGPDLSNLHHRDYTSVLRDVEQPSFAINPDHLSYVIELKDGRTLTGAIRSRGDRLLVGDDKGVVKEIARSEVETMKASPKSIMPEGLPNALGPARMKDLMTYLLREPPHMPRDARQKPPAARKRAEVDAILAGAPPKPANPPKPLRIVLVAGAKDHGPGEHDYPAWQRVWKDLLQVADGVAVETAWDWPSAAQLANADVMLFYQFGRWSKEKAKQIDAYLARGGGLIYIHYAVAGDPDAPDFAKRIGVAWQGGRSKFRHGPLDLGFNRTDNHPIGRNFTKVHFHDESYWQLTGDTSKIKLLASGVEDGKAQPLFWTLEPSRGRVFVSIPGHFSWTFDDPFFRILLLRGIAWTAREQVDRFNELATLGADVAE